jgi:DNA-binding NtrC family response regulator
MLLPRRMTDPDATGDTIGTAAPAGATADVVPPAEYGPLRERVRAFEHTLILDAISRHGSKRKAARALGVDIGTIVRKTQKSDQRDREPDDRPAKDRQAENQQGGIT